MLNKKIIELLLKNKEIFGIKSKSNIEIKPLGDGLRNKNFICKFSNKKITARIAISKESNLMKEFEYLNLIKSEDIAPYPFLYDKIENKEILFLEYIDGLHPTRMITQRIRIFAKLISKLHKIPIKDSKKEKTCFQLLKEDILEKYDEIKNKINDSEKCFFEDFFSKYLVEKVKSYKKCLVHGDLHKKNILVDGKKIKLIDFDSIGYGDNALELVEIFNEFHLNKRQKNIFIEEYNCAMNDSFLIDRIDMYYPAKYLYSYVWAIQGMHSGERNDDFYESEKKKSMQKLKRYKNSNSRS
jgi:thiamine kinase-like enzyme